MLNERRGTTRVTCFSKCFLIHMGSKYPGVLENISVSGALVTVTNSLPYVIQLEDSCDLIYCDDQVFHPGDYPSKVVRLSSPKIGLRFDLQPGV